MQKDPDFVTALARGLRILTCFQACDHELGNGEIAQRAGLPPATVARLTYTLTQLGYLRIVNHRRKYALSASVLSIGYPVLAALPDRELARGPLKALADSTKGSVCLAIREGLHAVYVEVSRGADVGQFPDIGQRRDLLGSSVGLALFVASEAQEQEAILNQACLITPARSSILRRAADRAREDYARYGMCKTDGLAVPGWAGLAMPIEGNGGIKFALSLGLQSQLLASEQAIRSAGLALAAAASRIQAALKRGPRIQSAVAVEPRSL
ncbi:MAG: helix-turn-helix domain-containing protein [Devosia sp.]